MSAPASPGTETPSLAGAAGTRRRLQALVAIGWTRAQLARRLGLTPPRLGRLLHHDGLVEAATAAAALALYDELWNHWPAGAAADRSRGYARARDWAVPMAWDDDQIDDPDAGPAPGWRRSDRTTRRAADLAADAAELITRQGYTRANAAARLGVTTSALDAALRRTRTACRHHPPQEGPAMPLDTTPRAASEYHRGAAFGHAMIMRQIDAGLPTSRIAQTQHAAKATLTAAARHDGDRDFAAGYAATVDDHLATLRAARQAETDAEAAERAAEREAG